MRRSRITGRAKSKDTQFGWYFAGEPMEKRHSRRSRIRLVRYGPEVEVCAHSRCPSPSPVSENAPCTCSNTCEVHPHGTRAPSPSNTDDSLYEAIRCCGGCHAIRRERERESSPQVEKMICTCNHRCERHSPETRTVTPSGSEYSGSESATRHHGGRHSARRERRSHDTRPTTPTSSDFSDRDLPRRRRTGHRTTTRGPEHHAQVEECQCEVHAPPPNTTARSSQRYTSPRASTAAAPLPSAVVHRHHCRKASYCEIYPERCRASVYAHLPVPRPTPTPTRSSESSEKSRRDSREKPDPRRTFRRSASPQKQTSPLKPAVSPKPASPRPNVQHCTCFWIDGYLADDSAHYDDTASEASIQAMPDSDRDVDESLCVYHHRCRPRFECGLGWVCGRK